MGYQGALEKPEGRPGGTERLKIVRGAPLDFLHLPGPPGFPCGSKWVIDITFSF